MLRWCSPTGPMDISKNLLLLILHLIHSAEISLNRAIPWMMWILSRASLLQVSSPEWPDTTK